VALPTVGLLTDAFGRIRQVVHRTADGLSADELAVRLEPGANTIGWLLWHLTRIQDDHIADVADLEQVYVVGGWWERLGRPFGVDDHGYGHSSDQVGSLHLESVKLLVDYYDAVHGQSVTYLETLRDADFARVVDVNWDPPVTLAVRLVSVISDCLQHAGQAAFIRGVIDRR
jgi:hypothetical protein